MNEKRIGILGNVDSGKSTIISVLTNNILDNGRGSARKKILKHDHEQDSGRTSCITHKYTKYNENTTLSFVDLAGHEKYYKTTIFGANCCSLDFVLLMVGANMGVSHMTREHLLLALILKLPIIFVISKIDLCPDEVLKNTLKDLNAILKRYKCTKEIVELNDTNKSDYYDLNSMKSFPILKVSNTSGLNINLLKDYLGNVKNYRNYEELKTQNTIVLVEDIFFVNGVGIVISGTVNSGTVKKSDKYMIGPFNGIFREVTIKSIHNNFREFEDEIPAGRSGCFNIKTNERKFQLKKKVLKRGMIMIDANSDEHTYMEFRAKVKILHHPTTIKQNYETMIHCGTIKQVAKIIFIEKDLLRTGDQSNVIFRFKRKPEFIQKNKQIIFREGKTKGIGVVTELLSSE
jgi:small GTP-binding protein